MASCPSFGFSPCLLQCFYSVLLAGLEAAAGCNKCRLVRWLMCPRALPRSKQHPYVVRVQQDAPQTAAGLAGTPRRPLDGSVCTWQRSVPVNSHRLPAREQRAHRWRTVGALAAGRSSCSFRSPRSAARTGRCKRVGRTRLRVEGSAQPRQQKAHLLQGLCTATASLAACCLTAGA